MDLYFSDLQNYLRFYVTDPDKIVNDLKIQGNT